MLPVIFLGDLEIQFVRFRFRHDALLGDDLETRLLVGLGQQRRAIEMDVREVEDAAPFDRAEPVALTIGLQAFMDRLLLHDQDVGPLRDAPVWNKEAKTLPSKA